jgi:hypothetical protein
MVDPSNMHRLRELKIYPCSDATYLPSALLTLSEISRMLATLPKMNSLELLRLDLETIGCRSLSPALDRELCNTRKYGKCRVYVGMQAPGDQLATCFQLFNVHCTIRQDRFIGRASGCYRNSRVRLHNCRPPAHSETTPMRDDWVGMSL